MKCMSCQADLGPETRICGFCGHPVSNNPTLEDLYFSRLAANAPPKLVQKVRSAPYLSKERRSVTAIMFTIANAEVFSRNIPETEQNAILNTALDRIAGIIFEFEGSIAKLWENTVLAFFGAPVTHEDDPLRAVHAAGSILEDIQTYSKALKEKFGIPIELHMVLNTGPILIGEVKSNLRFDFQSLNNTLECMDRATRMPIPRCEIILFEDTFRFVKPFVQCTELTEPLCSELEQDLHLWRVDHVNRPGSALLRTPVTRNTPLIGRKNELELLLELSETVLAGLGRVGVILGDPGTGKSRLVMEWKRRLSLLHQPTKPLWIEAHGQAFGRELAYHLLKSLLRSALDIGENYSDDQILANLQTSVNDLLRVDVETLTTYLAHLLDIQLTEEKETYIHQLNATELRGNYLNALRSFLKALAVEQPVILVLEDLHWADVSSVELLQELLPISATAPILVCLVTRPNRDSDGWALINIAREQIGPRLTEITLGNLDEQDSQALVGELIERQELPEVILKMILEKSEGNPFFIEELVRMLINEEMLVQVNGHWEVASNVNTKRIPDSLQGLLSARIDQLSPEARDTLRVASVIGRTFPERVIDRVLSTQSPNIELLEQLSTLESIGMIQVTRVHPELDYSFQHILLHEAAYHSIIEEDRNKIHLTVGTALEELYPEQMDRLASQLSYHFNKGNHPEKALTYLDKAGHVSMESFANAEAEFYFNKATELTSDHAQLAHLYSDLGEAQAQQGKHRQAVQTWWKAIEYHKEFKNFDRMARIYAWSARAAWWGYDPKRSLEICLEGLKAIGNKKESSDIAYLIHETGRAYFFNTQPDKARSFCERALEMARRMDAFDVQAESLATIGILPNITPQQAISALEMAVKISEDNNLYGPASRAYINLAFVIDSLGEIRKARDYHKRVLQLDIKTGAVADKLVINQSVIRASLWLADFDDAQDRIKQISENSSKPDSYLSENTLNFLLLTGSYQRYKGDFNPAINTFTDLIDRSRQVNDHGRILQANRNLAEIILESHLLDDEKRNSSDLDIAFNMITEAMQTYREDQTQSDVATQCLLSDIHALKGNPQEAEAALNKANDLHRDHPSMEDQVWITLSQARLELSRDNYADALEYLATGAQLLEKMEGRWWRARVWLEMGVILLKRNEPEDIDQAQSTFREALAEFREMDVLYYPDVIIEKLRQVKKVSRAQAIAHRMISQELAEAGRVQNSFIPTHSPTIEGFQISGVLLPAHETSGDFYDFIPLDDGKLGIVIADVGDKGAGAALYMAMSRTLIRTYAGEEAREPEDVIREVNRRILTDTQHGIFLTAVYGILDPAKSTFTYVNAGHNPPCLLGGKGENKTCTLLEKTGSLIGIFAENTWETKTITLLPDEYLVFYTDGITEAQDETDAFFGNDRLYEILLAGMGESAEAFRNGVLENVQAFTGTAPRLDDVTLIILKKN